MFPHHTFTAWATGNFTTSLTIGLDRNRRYLVTGGLVGKEGADHGQIYISTVCTMPSNDQVLCGLRDDPSDSADFMIKNHNLVEFLPPFATRVTIKLRSRGGRHRAEGVVYDIT